MMTYYAADLLGTVSRTVWICGFYRRILHEPSWPVESAVHKKSEAERNWRDQGRSEGTRPVYSNVTDSKGHEFSLQVYESLKVKTQVCDIDTNIPAVKETDTLFDRLAKSDGKTWHVKWWEVISKTVLEFTVCKFYSICAKLIREYMQGELLPGRTAGVSSTLESARIFSSSVWYQWNILSHRDEWQKTRWKIVSFSWIHCGKATILVQHEEKSNQSLLYRPVLRTRISSWWCNKGLLQFKWSLLQHANTSAKHLCWIFPPGIYVSIVRFFFHLRFSSFLNVQRFHSSGVALTIVWLRLQTNQQRPSYSHRIYWILDSFCYRLASIFLARTACTPLIATRKMPKVTCTFSLFCVNREDILMCET